MKSIYTVAIAIIAIAVIIGSVFAYTYLSNPSAEPTPTPTPAPTNTPTISPSVTPSATPGTTATPTPNPSSPTSSPTATIAPTPTPSPTPIPTPGPASITGSGATFPQPFIAATINTWQQIRTNVQINYQGVGSGSGINALTAKTVDFACSDAALTSSQASAAPNAVHIPETIGAITIAYNVPGVATGLKLTGPIIADIYLGTITNWNDQRITSINPGVNLPSNAIILVRRSESSGTTNWFTKYLSSQSTTWSNQVGSGTTVQWPGTTVGQSGNNGVAGYVDTTPYAIGYVELAYALTNTVPVAQIMNAAGNYITPSLASSTAAAQSIPTSGLPTGTGDWSGVSILNAPGAQAYPIVVPTYMLVYKELNVVPGMTIDKATQLVQYMWYVVHDGQSLAASLQYAALPANLVQIDETTLNSITFNGQTLVTH